jgi:hypothetical protein
MVIQINPKGAGMEFIAYSRTKKGKFIHGRVVIETLGTHERSEALLTFVNHVRSAQDVFVANYAKLREYTGNGETDGND